jgi:hypothetical protein
MGKRHKAKVGGVGKALKILEAKRSRRVKDEDEDKQSDYDDYLDNKGNMLFEKNNIAEDEDDEEVFGLHEGDDVS